MKIAICGSINLTPKIKEIADQLNELGHECEIPFTSKRIISGELSFEEFRREKEKQGDNAFRKIKHDVIKHYYNVIKDSNAVLVVNESRNNIENYIGGNTFLEIGYAHVLGKKIFLLNDIPGMLYTEEIEAMQPIIINKNLSLIQ